MNTPLKTEDMRSYLAASHWQRRPETWRGATLWDHPGGGTTLVPPHDRFDDLAERTRDLLRVLAKVEKRPVDDIARDIASPTVDTQSYRVLPPGLPSGEVSLLHGSGVFNAVTELYAYSARAVSIGNRPAFYGTRTKHVTKSLSAIRLAAPTAGSYIVNVRVPIEPPETLFGDDGKAPAERPIVDRLNQAIHALHNAVQQQLDAPSDTAFDATVNDGASANLCKALARLSLDNAPFEVRFGWARAVPGQRKAVDLRFPQHSKDILTAAAKHLTVVSLRGTVVLSGRIEGLQHKRNDPWRVKIAGSLQEEGYPGAENATLWARLTETDYQKAISAHSRERRVRVRGRCRLVGSARTIVVTEGDLVEET